MPLQAISLVISAAGRGAKDRSHDGVLCPALLSTQSGYIYQYGHLLCAQLCDYYAQYISAQPIGK